MKIVVGFGKRKRNNIFTMDTYGDEPSAGNDAQRKNVGKLAEIDSQIELKIAPKNLTWQLNDWGIQNLERVWGRESLGGFSNEIIYR